ncbi:ataxin-2 homolog isoform X2 [Episyrphus balteatus]|uniref:ataxin-2 homolog isoform X2 n=1 Tax=Episyrphus balteatus TaxID=286459 RepID=UPI0024850EB9|nr:ataxin-2 homolog isoform X2 [Episyrphus balteatus]
MKLRFCLVVSTTCLIGCVLSETTAKPQGFSPRSFEEDDENLDPQEQTHPAYRSRQYDYSSEEEQEEPPRQLYQSRNPIKPNTNYLKPNKNVKVASEEEEEIEEPDRLTTLLEKSQFNCNSKTTGYYADESLACEVFHYCQENQRHSWICPEGFTFHQIHLICMPPSNDNICDQSSKYHIVNDYLYKPINLQEHQSKPNVTLRYSDRYYPENYYENDNQEEERDTRQRVHHQQRQPVQIGFNSQQRQHHQQPAYQAPTYPQAQAQQQQPQPQVRKTPPPAQPVQLAQQTIATSPTPQSQYRYITQAPTQQYQQQVYRTPEEINISLQQRRPQLFAPTSTPRYYEEDYLYERRK